jgi:hypothetical protein
VDKSSKDSLVSDSLKNEYNLATTNVIKYNKIANYYLNKFSNSEKNIYLIENNKNYKSGDILLFSLSKNIN